MRIALLSASYASLIEMECRLARLPGCPPAHRHRQDKPTDKLELKQIETKGFSMEGASKKSAN